MTLFEYAEQRAVAERAATEGIDRVEATNARWVESTARLIADLASQGREFTADKVWPLVPTPPTNPSAMGAAFRLAAARGWIKRAPGFRTSLRPQTHLRPLRLWVRGCANVVFSDSPEAARSEGEKGNESR
jgi:hypothetical protein